MGPPGPASARGAATRTCFINLVPLRLAPSSSYLFRMMPDQASRRRFEVWVLRDKRWLIDCLARNEDEARARAEELYADDDIAGGARGARPFRRGRHVLRDRPVERVRAARRGEPPVRIAAAPDEEAWCETLDDLYGPASRRAIARLLRNFLDRYAITPTELLHHHRYIKQLERQDELMGQAMQRIAAHQARARGIDMRQRLDALDRLVNAAIEPGARCARLARRAAPRRGRPRGARAKRWPRARKRHRIRRSTCAVAVSRAFEDQGVLSAKMDMLTRWADAPTCRRRSCRSSTSSRPGCWARHRCSRKCSGRSRISPPRSRCSPISPRAAVRPKARSRRRSLRSPRCSAATACRETRRVSSSACSASWRATSR